MPTVDQFSRTFSVGLSYTGSECNVLFEASAQPVRALCRSASPRVDRVSVAISDVPADPQPVEVLRRCSDACARLKRQVSTVVVGQEQVIDNMLVALLARGHALLVGVPGLAKTLLVSSIARSLGLSFGRVQFTPDLLPADITGADVMSEVERSGFSRPALSFQPGPIFKNLVLADEINRTPPKTQAALLQAMQERCVTVGGNTHPLPSPFQVFATRNPIEQEGTYPLPEAQLDRFLLEIHIDYPSEEDELVIARRSPESGTESLEAVISPDEVRAFGALVPKIPVTDEAVSLAVAVARASRPETTTSKDVRQYVRYGAGPRGTQALVLAAQARTLLRGDAAADVDDVLSVVGPALRHRLVLGYRAEADGVKSIELVRELVREQRGRLRL
jgi:MoxR-like ATPase